MKIFISWSGPLSKAVALALREWLERVIQGVKPWMSEEDIPTGTMWFDGISESIENSQYGILCLTRENKNAPWMLWEAGALYRGFNDPSRVVPLLIDLQKDELDMPLSKLQGFTATDKIKMLKMLREINELHYRISRKNLEKQLNLYWDEWQAAVNVAIAKHPHRSASESTCEYSFKNAADEFIKIKSSQNISIRRYEDALKYPLLYVGDLSLDLVNNDTLKPFVQARRAGTIRVPEGEKVPKPSAPRTINKDLQTVEAVLKLAVQELEWIPYAPKIIRVPLRDKKIPYILSWDQQRKLLSQLPGYVKQAALFAVNTGARKGLIRDLEWAWMKDIPEFEISVFMIPPGVQGSKYERTILLNSVAQSVIDMQESQKGHQKYVFPSPRGVQIAVQKPWQKAWQCTGLPTDRGYAQGFDNLRRTFERRLRDSGVSVDDREQLLWVSRALRLQENEPLDYEHLLRQLEKISMPADVIELVAGSRH